MKIVLQRVHFAKLTSGEYSSEIGFGLLVTVGVNKEDTLADVNYLAKKIANLRMFKDDNDKTNLSVLDVDGEILVVSNFTLQGNAQRGTRPDFSHAGDSDFANKLYLLLIDELKANGVRKVEKGSFGNHMHIDAELDGPFTIILESQGRNL